MNKPIFKFIPLLLCSLSTHAATLSGTVTDSLTHSRIDGATIIARGSTATQQYIAHSDSIGQWVMKGVVAGSYEITISYIGYSTRTSTLSITRDTMIVFALAPTSQQLREATVVSTKAVITHSADRTVFNVAQSPSHQVGTAEDVLRNMPGVTLDQKSNITIIGKQGITILVDDKPAPLAQSNLQAFLKSIPANTIDKIEVITNPSARYDANGNAGIINIKLKKGKRVGFNGSATVTVGYPNRYSGNLTSNYRKNKVNLFASYAPSYFKEGHEYIESRDITIRDTTTHYALNQNNVETTISHAGKAGIDYFINDRNTLTYTFGIDYSTSSFPATAYAHLYDGSNHPTTDYTTRTLDHWQNTAIANSLNYTHRYDTTAREFAMSLTHSYVQGNNESQLNSFAYDTLGQSLPLQQLRRHTASVNHIHNVIVQFSYVQPLRWAGHRIETGMKNETTLNRNNYEVQDTTAGIISENKLLSNSFEYVENINAFYMLYSGAHKSWLTYSAGIRAEHTLIQSQNNNVSRNYLSFFPSASIAATLSETQQLSLSYSRRVQRPEFRQLNNNITYFDQYSTWEGNPYLRPSFSHTISMNYSLSKGKHIFSVTPEVFFKSDVFNESSHTDSTRITRGGVINGGNGFIAAMSVYAKIQITKWWEVQMNHNIFYTHYDYQPGVNSAAVNGATYNLWSDMSFRFWKNTTLNFNGWVNTGEVFFQGKTKPNGSLTASIKKEFLHDHLTVSIVAQNLLNTMHWQWYVNTTNLHTNGSWQIFNRAVMLSISYRFGRDANALNRKDIEGNSRLSGGGKAR